MLFLEKMKAAAAEAARPVDPWRMRHERVRGTMGFDALERISTQPGHPGGSSAPADCGHGWTAVRVRDLTRGGYREQVRGASAVH